MEERRGEARGERGGKGKERRQGEGEEARGRRGGREGGRGREGGKGGRERQGQGGIGGGRGRDTREGKRSHLVIPLLHTSVMYKQGKAGEPRLTHRPTAVHTAPSPSSPHSSETEGTALSVVRPWAVHSQTEYVPTQQAHNHTFL